MLIIIGSFIILYATTNRLINIVCYMFGITRNIDNYIDYVSSIHEITCIHVIDYFTV